jgi:cell wall-associated NlpC family hydrolase
VTISKETARRTTRTATNGVKTVLQKHWKNKAQRKSAKKTRERSAEGVTTGVKTGVNSAVKAGQFLTKTMQTVRQAVVTNPVVWTAILVILLLAMIVGLIGVIIGSGGAANESQDGTYQAQVSEKTESFRDLVSDYCEKYGIDDYVDLCLAMIEQESGGTEPDVMQTEQSYYNVNPPIDSAEESIDCGTHELSDCLTKAKCKSPNDINGISLALQGYNFGNGYIDWALKNYGCYTKENAEIFSKKMCTELGYASYGDVDYVPHVLQYYVENSETSISNESAKSILEELKENNSASAERWNVVEQGASLVGSVQYSMEKRQADGRDYPEFLDCSSFTAWAFHKSGITSVSYSSTTATFIASKKFVDIRGDELQPGDIGLKSKTGGTGGANHVGIYAGKMKDGTVVWLHCTSSSSSSLTGNTEGVMLGAYTNFTYFRRLKKWN